MRWSSISGDFSVVVGLNNVSEIVVRPDGVLLLMNSTIYILDGRQPFDLTCTFLAAFMTTISVNVYSASKYEQ